MSYTKKHIQDPYFTMIFDGSKVAEGRVILEGFWNLDLLGHVFTFHNGVEEFDVRVTRVDAFYGVTKRLAIENMLSAVGYRRLLPDANSFESAVGVYSSFGDDTTTRMAAFYIEVVSGLRPHTG